MMSLSGSGNAPKQLNGRLEPDFQPFPSIRKLSIPHAPSQIAILVAPLGGVWGLVRSPDG